MYHHLINNNGCINYKCNYIYIYRYIVSYTYNAIMYTLLNERPRESCVLVRNGVLTPVTYSRFHCLKLNDHRFLSTEYLKIVVKSFKIHITEKVFEYFYLNYFTRILHKCTHFCLRYKNDDCGICYQASRNL